MQSFCMITGFLAFVGFLIALIVEAVKKSKRGINICGIGIGISVFVFLLGLFGDTVSSFIGMLGFFGGLISLIMFVVNLVRRNNKIAYIFVATLLVSCVLFAVGVFMDVSPSQDDGKAEPDSGTTDSLMSAEEQSIVDILRDNDAFDAVFSVTKNDSGKYDVLGMYTKYPDRWSDIRWCAIDAAGLLNSVNQYHPEIYAQLGEVKLNFSISAGNGYFTKIAVPDYADGNSIQFTNLNDADDVVTVTPEDMEKAQQELKESELEKAPDDLSANDWKYTFSSNGFTDGEINEYGTILNNIGIKSFHDVDITENGIMHVIRGKIFDSENLQLNITLENRKIIYISLAGIPANKTEAYINWRGKLKIRTVDTTTSVDMYSDTEGGYLAKLDWESKTISEYEN